MAVHAPSTRRDRRHSLPLGAGVVEIPQTVSKTRPLTATLTKISAAGVAFALDAPIAGIEVGAPLRGVQLRIGVCVLGGDILVRDVRPLEGTSTEVGGVFLPEGREAEARLMALVAGIGAARAE